MRRQAISSMTSTTARLAALAVGGVLLVTACGGSGDSGSSGDNGAPVKISSDQRSIFRGTELGSPLAKPDLVLTDTSGQPYDLKARTQGRTTLLYFGYTHCPDVCPTSMGDVARALTKLSAEDRAKVDVVFVTTDPERDTPAALREWLDMMDRSFVGLTGDFATIQAAARSVGVAIEPPTTTPDGKIVSTHGSQVVAFSPDGQARVIYLASTGTNPDGTPNGITADDYAHDLPLLIQGRHS
jgi:protein SCO1/2